MGFVRQHFFSAILIPEKPVDQLTVTTDNLADDRSLDEVFTKKFGVQIPLAYQSGEFGSRFEYYFGTTDYQTLKSYDRDLESSIPLGWVSLAGSTDLSFAFIWILIFLFTAWDLHYLNDHYCSFGYVSRYLQVLCFPN